MKLCVFIEPFLYVPFRTIIDIAREIFQFLSAPPPPLKMAGIQTLNFCRGHLKNEIRRVYICRRLWRKNPNPWSAEEKWNVLGWWIKDVLPLQQQQQQQQQQQ